MLLLTKNVGAKDVLVVTEGSVLFVYAIKVVGPDGKPTPLTSYGQKAKKWAGSGSAATDKLGPGQEDTSDLLLGRIFDMTREGEYKISFSQSIWPARGMPPVDVSSNVLIITVLGEKAEYAPSK
ncbi:MAG: hypothetical protein HYR84_14790 [Planctomycetes bacterium]|nr:hypothetical protein [Planctomycetota bacterium]